MPNRRARTRRKDNIIIKTISNKVFIRVSSVLIAIIILCLAIMRLLNIKENERIAKSPDELRRDFPRNPRSQQQL